MCAAPNVQATSAKTAWERHEAKYVIHPAQLPAMREFLKSWCVPDPNGSGEFPQYTVTTLQLDTPDLAFYHAKEEENLNRFKLRIRTYGTERNHHKVYLEIKRKFRGVIVKTRTTLPADLYGSHLFSLNGDAVLPFKSEGERNNYYEFLRVMRELNCEPKVLIRYRRESYFGTNDHYARITFDREITYRPTRDYDLWPAGGGWWSIDSATVLNRPFSGIVLEIKTYDEVPAWVEDFIQTFSLTRCGYCKYHNAIRMELLFTGMAYSEASESTFG